MTFFKCFLSFYIKRGKGGALLRKRGAKMNNGKSPYFNGIVNNLMDKFYFDKEFMRNLHV
ncbi:hypothetical protein FJ659_15450 [Bacillus dicomae]|uniref:Uncharacterized protein n=1 Tax=Bacillus dicomae TaxID=3088378 RepID=A0AC61T6Z6_9BACI|nr:hypothetical protein FJ659_15450 [Bacillus dicomae]